MVDTGEDIALLNEELKVANDRTACIILSAMIERTLERLLVWRIDMGVFIEKDHKEALFERDGALSTFYGNIRLGRALRLYGDKLAADLDIIRRVRNAFAHTALPILFKSNEILKETAKFSNAIHAHRKIDEEQLANLSSERRGFASTCLQVMFALVESLDATIKLFEEMKDDMLSSWRATLIRDGNMPQS